MTSSKQSAGSDPDPDKRAGTLERGLAILEMLCTRGSVAANEMVGELRLSRSATYRILALLR